MNISNIQVDLLKGLSEGTVPLPSGWLSGFEVAVLYTSVIALKANTAILEVGSWIGRSSCVLAYAVRDKCPTKVRFDIVDYGITGSDEWMQRFGSSVFEHSDAKALCEVVFAAGGTIAKLKQNLVDRGISQFVTQITLGDVADFASHVKYELIFCDATHDESEIRKNIPILASHLSSDFILICDDIHTEEHCKLISDLVGAEQGYMCNKSDVYCDFALLTKGRYNGFLG